MELNLPVDLSLLNMFVVIYVLQTQHLICLTIYRQIWSDSPDAVMMSHVTANERNEEDRNDNNCAIADTQALLPNVTRFQTAVSETRPPYQNLSGFTSSTIVEKETNIDTTSKNGKVLNCTFMLAIASTQPTSISSGSCTIIMSAFASTSYTFPM